MESARLSQPRTGCRRSSWMRRTTTRRATGRLLGKRLRDEVPFTLNDVESISRALGLDLPEL